MSLYKTRSVDQHWNVAHLVYFDCQGIVKITSSTHTGLEFSLQMVLVVLGILNACVLLLLCCVSGLISLSSWLLFKVSICGEFQALFLSLVFPFNFFITISLLLLVDVICCKEHILFCNVWVCVYVNFVTCEFVYMLILSCVAVLVICVLVYTVFCFASFMYFIYFVCTSVSSTATEWKLNYSK